MKTHQLKWQTHSLELSLRTRVMGILNITPDSFSDGGKFFSTESALKRAEEMVAEGADIIDIGGESSRPFSMPVPADEEVRRVIPVIEKLSARISVPISIDTTKARVADRALSAGASIVNDISALRFDPELGQVVAERGALLILMHMKGMPADMQVNPAYENLMGDIFSFLSQAVGRAESFGIKRSKLILDPGIGFGKTVSHNLQILKDLRKLRQIGLPLLVGTSRKAFIRKILAGDQQDELAAAHPLIAAGTQASISAAVLHGAHIVRVHDVASAVATVRIIDALINCDGSVETH